MTIKRGFPAHLVVFSDSGKEISGVTTTLNNLADYYERAGQRFTLIDRRQVKTLPNPLYPAMPFGLCNPSILEELLVKHDALPTPETAWHVHTEGPIGVSALLFAHDKQLSITTAFTTRFEEYLSWIPKGLCWYALRKFHNASCVKRTLAPTETMKKLLIEHGFDPGRLGLLSRGPSELFRPRPKDSSLKRPIIGFVGRISEEHKRISRVFELLKLPISIVAQLWIIGDGPDLDAFRSDKMLQFEITRGRLVFFGEKRGEELAELYSQLDVFAQPSDRETIGNTVLEALASGVPVAAVPGIGQEDILVSEEIGVIDSDLRFAVKRVLSTGVSARCVQHVRTNYTIARMAAQLLEQVVPVVKT